MAAWFRFCTADGTTACPTGKEAMVKTKGGPNAWEDGGAGRGAAAIAGAGGGRGEGEGWEERGMEGGPRGAPGACCGALDGCCCCSCPVLRVAEGPRACACKGLAPAPSPSAPPPPAEGVGGACAFITAGGALLAPSAVVVATPASAACLLAEGAGDPSSRMRGGVSSSLAAAVSPGRYGPFPLVPAPATEAADPVAEALIV